MKGSSDSAGMGSAPLRARRLREQGGFTLIELMTAVLVAAILLAMAVPSFQSTINGGRLATASNELLTGLQTARMEAIRYNVRTEVCLSTNADTATPTCGPATSSAAPASGWIAFVDKNKNGTYESTDKLLRQATVPPKVRLTASSSIPGQVRVVFRSDGFARDTAGTGFLTGAIDACLPTRRPAENIRRVLIGSGSRINVSRVDAGAAACNAPP